MRALLNFLVSKLPRSADEKGAADDDNSAEGAVSLQQQIVDHLRRFGARDWTPITSEAERTAVVSTVPLVLPSVDDDNADAVRYASFFQPLLSSQCTRNQLAPSLFELHARYAPTRSTLPSLLSFCAVHCVLILCDGDGAAAAAVCLHNR
jgi:hypothetical protein